MTSEPERPIEKLLQAAAKKRREEAGPPLELSTVTRRLLQAEVAREFASQAQAPRIRGWQAFFSGLASRWVFALGTASLLVLAGIWWLGSTHDRGQNTLLAKNERARLELARPTSSLPASATGSKTKTATQSTLLTAADEPQQVTEKGTATWSFAEAETAKNVDLTAVNQHAGRAGQLDAVVQEPVNPVGQDAKPPEQPSLAQENQLLVRRYGGAAAKASDRLGQPSTNAIALGASLALRTDQPIAGPEESRKRAAGTEVSQEFHRVASVASAPAPVEKDSAGLPVMNSFRFEQAGRELRIIDADGSIYSGSMVPSASREALARDAFKPSTARSLNEATSAGQSSAGPAGTRNPGTPQYLFRVAGTNRSLNQMVVFSGTVVGLSNAIPNLQMNGSLGGQIAERARGQSDQPRSEAAPWLNSRISGKLTVGSSQEMPFEAVPAKR